jgi:UDP-glucose 4-epimerase
LNWNARYAGEDTPAVVVDPTALRRGDPSRIEANPEAALRDLAWKPTTDLTLLMRDVLGIESLDVG